MKPFFCLFLHPLAPILASSWAYLGPLWAVLGPSWLQLGRSWGHFGSNLGDLGANLGDLGANLGDLEANLGHLGAILPPSLTSSWLLYANLQNVKKTSQNTRFFQYF